MPYKDLDQRREYQRQYSRNVLGKHPHPTREERFWKQVSIADSGFESLAECCWIWTGPKHERDGYGRFVSHIKGSHPPKKNKEQAHRVAYSLVVGLIPPFLVPDHLCRNRLCVNPYHLEWVSAKTNILRGVGPAANNARCENCIHGHPLNGINLYITPDGRRQCRTCIRIRSKKHRFLTS